MSSIKLLLSTFMYFLGCGLLIFASVLLINESSPLCNIVCISGCASIFIASSIELIMVIMLKPIKQEFNEIYSLTSTVDSNRIDNWKQELIIYIFYFIWGSFYFIASIINWPNFDLFALSTWMFRFGSIFYIIGSLSNLFHIINSKNESIRKEFSKSQILFISNLIMTEIGALCYFVSGILFETVGDKLTANGILLLIGSIFFTLGSVLKIYDVGKKLEIII